MKPWFSFPAVPVLLIAVTSLFVSGCGGSSDDHNHSSTYYHSSGFHDPYYYGGGYYGGYDEVIVVPPVYNHGNNNGNKPQNPDRPGAGSGLKPSHPIAGSPSTRPAHGATRPQPRATPSIPSRARPSSMGSRGGMRGGGMRGGGGRRR